MPEKHSKHFIESYGADAFQLMANAAPVMVWVSGTDAKCTFFNRRWLEFTGRTMEQELGDGWAEGVHKDDFARCLEIYLSSFEARQPFSMEYRLRRADGEYRWIIDNGEPWSDPQGRFAGFIGACIDVTDRRRADEAVRQSTEFLRNMFEHAPMHIALIDRAGKIRIVNRAVENLLGATKSAIEGTQLAAYYARDVAERLMGHVRTAIEQSTEVRFEVSAPYPIGSRDFDVVVYPLEHNGETLACAIGLDVTERRRLEEKLLHAQKLESLGVLAGGLAHDFNNLLVGVLGNAGLAKLELTPGAPAWRPVEQIEIAALRAADLTKQMLAYSGRGRFVVQPVNLSRLVEEMANLLQSAISKRALLRFDFAQALPSVEADATQVRQIVMNLITNASDAIGDRSGVISLRTGVMDADASYLATSIAGQGREPGTYAFVEVSDTGVGMDAETMARIWDPFFSTKFTGRGLGLAAVLGIVRAHKGAIRIYSERGKGSTFRVLLPCSDQPVHESSGGSRTEAPWRGSGTVLIVDDDESVRAVAKNALSRSGFSVLTAADGGEALEHFRKSAGSIVCVLLDLTMPKMGGEATFRELRRLDPKVRVVLMSGYNSQEATSEFTGKGLAGFLQKPFQVTELLGALKDVLGSSAG